jgi:hypothetical protein
LKSGKYGKKGNSRKQAIAIGLSGGAQSRSQGAQEEIGEVYKERILARSIFLQIPEGIFLFAQLMENPKDGDTLAVFWILS